MDFKHSLIALILCVIVIGLCELLVPNDSHKNQMRLITGTILLIGILSLFMNGFELKEFDFQSIESNINISESAERSVAYSAKNETAEILKKEGISNAKIIINTGRDEKNSIILDSIIILFDKKDKTNSQKIINLIKEKFNIKVESGEL